MHQFIQHSFETIFDRIYLGWIERIFPTFFIPYPGSTFERLVLLPFQFLEALMLIPTRYLRRHFPLLGGVAVVLMTSCGMICRFVLDSIWTSFFNLTLRSTTKAAPANFAAFCRIMRRDYADWGNLDDGHEWAFIRRLYVDKIQCHTSQADLWRTCEQCLDFLDDPALTLSRQGPNLKGSIPDIDAPLEARLEVIRRHSLSHSGESVANDSMVFGQVLQRQKNGSVVGYLAILRLNGFVDMPEISGWFPQVSRVPEIYDIEALRWTLASILTSFEQANVTRMILDLRFHKGGGSSVSACHGAASFIEAGTTLFYLQERIMSSDSGFGMWHAQKCPEVLKVFRGPVAVLQGPDTSGSGELMALAMQARTCSTKFFGRATRSSGVSGLRHSRLPNGWTLSVPTQRIRGSNHSIVRRSSDRLPVDVALDPTVKPLEPDVFFEAAIEYLSS